METVYGRATQLQDQMYHEHSYPSHLVEVLEAVIRDQPFFVFVHRSRFSASSQAYFHEFLHGIEKEEFQDSRTTKSFHADLVNKAKNEKTNEFFRQVS